MNLLKRIVRDLAMVVFAWGTSITLLHLKGEQLSALDSLGLMLIIALFRFAPYARDLNEKSFAHTKERQKAKARARYQK